MGFTNPSRSRAIAVAVAALLTGSVLVVAQPAVADTAPISPSTPATVTADALPTVQVNGVVWDQEIVGNVVYAVGEFTSAQPAGAAAGVSTSPRSNMLTYNLTTGVLIPGFAPTFNGRISTVDATPDGSKVFVGGQFTQVNGVARYRVAGFNVATGALLSFAPAVNSAVDAVEVTDTTAYIGGNFTAIGSATRLRAAAITIANGTPLPFAPTVEGGRVRGIAVSPDKAKVVLAGSFTSVNGSSKPGYGMAAVNASDGTLLPWGANDLIRNGGTGTSVSGGTGASIYGLTSDGDSVYGVGYDYYGGGNLEGGFRASWSDGSIQWVESCHGDSYSIAAQGDTVYTAGHSYYCGNNGGFPATEPRTFQRGLAWSKETGGRVNSADPYGYYNYAGVPSPELLNWWPDINTGTFTGQNQGAWSVVANDNYVLYAGEFTTINNKRQQGLVRFAKKELAPNKEGPRLSGINFVPSAVSLTSGTVRLSWIANYDRDNQYLTYDVIRDNNQAKPVYTVVKGSRSWFDRPTMGFTDRGLVPGQTYNYRLRTTDPSGNTSLGANTSVTVSSDGAFSPYAAAVADDGASSFWRLGESTGSEVYDWAGFSDGVASAGVTRGASGAIAGDSNTASTFSGKGDGLVATQTDIQGPNTFAIEAWFKTSSTGGGKIVGFGDRNTGESSAYDRHIYMDGSGRVIFGVYPNDLRTVQSDAGYNDGQWHQVVANLGPTGMQLYIDGVRVAQRSDTTSGQDYRGYWRIGGDSSWAGNNYFAGSIDDVAIYDAPLSVQKVNDHLVKSGRASALPAPPTDNYGATVFADSPEIYWRLGETTGSVAADATYGDTGIYSGGVSKAVPGGIAGTSDTAAAFDGVDGLVSSSRQYSNPQVFSVELWFNSTTSDGGKLIGFGRQQTGDSSSYDRHVYLDDSGRLVFGIYDGNLNTITTSGRYNDGKWHQVVGTVDSSGMKLYVDGELAGTNGATTAENYDGYWRVGGDNTWGSRSKYVRSAIDEVAVYSTALSGSSVSAHYAAGRGVVANQPPTAQFTPTTDGLAVSVDGSASADADGSIGSYLWNFGDGTSSTNPVASRTYTSPGTYTVTLTVTDDDGATGVTTREVTVVRPNVAPAAAFSSSVTNLSVDFDASASADSDGIVTTYSWNFGDSTTGTGAVSTHKYTEAGVYPVTLTVTDNAGLSSTITKDVRVAPAPNLAPTAAFSSTSSALAASFDGRGSTDTDGTITSWAWNFGDTTVGSGAQVDHTYGAAGTYPVTLTVADNTGAVSSTVKSVVITSPVANGPIAADGFGRTSTSSLGVAEVGGQWTTTGSAANYATTGGVATLRMPAPGANTNAYLPAVSSTDTDMQVTSTLRQAPTGSGVFVGLTGRKVGNSEYRARVVVAASGSVVLQAQRDNTTLQAVVVSGLTYAVGDPLRIRLRVFGTSPTTIQAKVWKQGAPEPSSWQVSRTDGTAALQQSGSVGLSAYLSGTATATPLTVTFDDLIAGSTTGTPVVAPPANVAPVASFTSVESGLTTSLNASASSDSDGTIASYSWAYGDGSSGTGVASSRTFTAPGMYSVVLTVTDNAGSSSTSTKQVTVREPDVTPPVTPGAVATDMFERTVAAGLGSADVGGAWTTGAGGATYAVSAGEAQLTAPRAGVTTSAYLSTVSTASTDTTVTLSVDKPATGGGTSVMVVGRRIGSDEYRARLLFNPSGTVALTAQRGTTTLQAALIPSLTYATGEKLRVRVQVSGTSPTTIRAKVWRVGTAEPDGWLVSVTDSTPALQSPGQVGLGTYLSGTATAVPVTVRFDDLSIVAVQ